MRILFILCFFLSSMLHAQDYFLKTYSGLSTLAPFYYSDLVETDNGTLHAYTSNDGEVMLQRINKCGEEIWTKVIKNDSLSMNIIDLEVDRNGNFIFVGSIGPSLSALDLDVFVMSVTPSGSVNFMKVFDTPPTYTDRPTALLQNAGGDFYLLFNYNSRAGSLGKSTIIKMDLNAKVDWIKSYVSIYGYSAPAAITSDGGILLSGILFPRGGSVIKIDSSGELQWSKAYSGLGNGIQVIEVQGGYILLYRKVFSPNTINLLKIDNSGKVLWISNDFADFRPREGILRENGNVLYTGGRQGVVLLEVDTSSGAIVRFKQYDPQNNGNLGGLSLYEDAKSNVLISGVDSLFAPKEMFYLKVDSSLDLPDCSPLDVQRLNVKTLNTIDSALNDLLIENIPLQMFNIIDGDYKDSVVTFGSPITSCSFTRDRGNLDLELGMDTILCPEALLQLGNTTSNFDEYIWSTGAKSKQITINSAGSYVLNGVVACDTTRDTINIAYYPNVEFFIGEDTSICAGDSLQLRSNFTLSNYLWSTGETTSNITVKNPGIYWLETTTICGKVRDSIELSIFPQASRLELGRDTSLCPDEGLILGDSLSDFDRFNWSTGATTPLISIRDTGLYFLEATTLCDTLRDSIRIGLSPTLQVSFTVDNLRPKTFEPVQFVRNERNGVAVRWDFGDGESVSGDTAIHEYKVAGNYTALLTVTSADGCEFSSSQEIVVQPSDYSLPNVFSPNNDGINDEFKPLGKDIQSYRLRIYDRWGKEVFSKRETAWDGRNKNGRKLASGVYFYVITLHWNHGGSVELEGNLQLLR